jgi:hypothetical protein
MKTFALVLMVAATACGGAAEQDPAASVGQGRTSELVLAVDSASYTAGGTVQFRLINRSTQQVGYNLCTASLERRAASVWETVLDQRMCTMEIRLLAPGDSAASTRELDPNLATGEYRITTRLHIGETPREVASEPFTIR